MIANSNAKTTRRVVVLTAAIAAVTLALVTAAVVVVSTMIIQSAHASCVTNPKNGARACSGGSPFLAASTSSQSGAHTVAASGPSGSGSVSGAHISTSHNFEGLGNCADKTCSGNK